jgi:hypothetical protein
MALIFVPYVQLIKHINNHFILIVYLIFTNVWGPSNPIGADGTFPKETELIQLDFLLNMK